MDSQLNKMIEAWEGDLPYTQRDLQNLSLVWAKEQLIPNANDYWLLNHIRIGLLGCYCDKGLKHYSMEELWLLYYALMAKNKIWDNEGKWISR